LTIQLDGTAESTPLTLDATAPVAGPPSTIQVSDAAQFVDGDYVSILGKSYELTGRAADGAGNARFTVTPEISKGVKWVKGTLVRKLRMANTPAAASKTLLIAGAHRLYKDAIAELTDVVGKKEMVVCDFVEGDVATFTKPLVGQYREGDKCRVIEAQVTIRHAPDGVLESQEEFENLRLTKGDKSHDIGVVISNRSAFVDATLDKTVVSLADFPVAGEQFQFRPLKDGDDKTDQMSVDDFVGVDGGSGNRTGIQAFEDIEDISIVLAPNMWSPVVQSAAITHCEYMRYRVAILDPPPKATIETIQTFRDPLDTKYAALYYPWLKVRDPILAADVDVASSAHVAGIYARVDTERGVHKAPANEVIRGITGLEQDITKREQDVLNPKNINCHRFFAGRGFRVWGARTVTSDSNFRYINVRRIFNFIERSIDVGTQFVVFEPNDETLWARVRQTIGNFLNTQWRSGMLEGKTAEEAYFVACDRGATMTQDDIENGRLICEIGIAPVYPAEFVIFRIQKFTADSKLA
jgi:phage tail sheath protein FI